MLIPYELLGGEQTVRRLAGRFYDLMELHEPELLAVHQRTADGRVSEQTRARFTTFLIEWLGGPAEYSPLYGHPRLRMRHAHVAIDAAQRDAWLRTMQRALDEIDAKGEVRVFLDERFAHVANFLRNVPDTGGDRH